MLNGMMIQFFHWYNTDGTLWKIVAKEAPRLKELGITAAWLPPAFKGSKGRDSRGYDVYDLYDLGEFDQKGTVRTRYGTKEEYLEAVKQLKANGIQVIVDVVFNHLGGADETEEVWVKKVDPEDRTQFISDPYPIIAHTKFTYPGRKGKYSQFEWNHTCFTGVDYDDRTKESTIFSIQNEYGEGWEDVIDTEKGNFDYLMCADVEHRNVAVREELKKWGEWYLDAVGFDGVRLDAVKHISPGWINEWLDHMRSKKPELFAVAEYWAPGQLHLLKRYLDATEGRVTLFDASFHHALYAASLQGREYDLTKIFDESLVAEVPVHAVTVVDNHDTQPLQALEAPVNPWFKALAYALILLREKGYPCIFYPDLYGTKYKDKGHDGNEYEIELPVCKELEPLMQARQLFAHGLERNYIDHPNCIGWTREGEEAKLNGCAVVLSNGEDGSKRMEIGAQYKSRSFVDYLGNHDAEILIGEDGWAEFLCKGGKVSVWVQKEKA